MGVDNSLASSSRSSSSGGGGGGRGNCCDVVVGSCSSNPKPSALWSVPEPTAQAIEASGIRASFVIPV